MSIDSAPRLVRAFPAELESEVLDVVAILPAAAHPPSGTDIGPVMLEGRQIRIPSRIYNPRPAPGDVTRLNSMQTLILNCLFTRHHDGHIREEALRRIVRHCQPWIPPFTVQLLGEYVIEIIEVLDQHLADEHRPTYAAFLAENSAFLHLTRQRVISYWNCYFRSQFRQRHDYVGVRVLHRLESWRDWGVRAPAG